MKTHFRVMLTWLTKYRGPGLVSGIVVFGLFVALASDARSSSWKDKNWSQWTPEDIQEILWYSPWASFIKQDSPPADRTRSPVPTPRAIIVSSLVIRQVFAKVGQSTFFTFPSMPGQQIIEPGDVDCINENFADRIIVRFFNEEGAFKTPPDLIVSGRKIQPLPNHRANSTNCAIGGGNDVSYPRMVGGKAVFKSGGDNLVIKTDLDRRPPGIGSTDYWPFSQVDTRFTFDTKAMVYKGKRDF
jgi:hypothetical protein